MVTIKWCGHKRDFDYCLCWSATTDQLLITFGEGDGGDGRTVPEYRQCSSL